MKTHKKYDDEFKAGAVRLLIVGGQIDIGEKSQIAVSEFLIKNHIVISILNRERL